MLCVFHVSAVSLSRTSETRKTQRSYLVPSMSFPKPPPPAMFLWAVISRYGEAADWVRRRIEGTTLDAAGAEAAWGPVVLTSPPFAFDQTEYYRKSMGEGLTKVFLACGARTDPARLAEAKRQS